MAISGANTSTTVKIATPVMRWSMSRRRQLIGGTPCRTTTLFIDSGTSPRRLAARHRPHQQLCQRVHDNRNQKQGQSNLYQSGKVDVAGSLAELVGEHAGHGVSRREQ